MMYRVLKVADRNADSAAIFYRYHVQEYRTKCFWKRNNGWHDVKRLVCYGMDCYKESVIFSDPERASKYLENIMEKLPKPTIIEVAKTFY